MKSWWLSGAVAQSLFALTSGCGSVNATTPDAGNGSSGDPATDGSVADGPVADSPTASQLVNSSSAGTVAENGSLSLKTLLVTTDGAQAASTLVYTVTALPTQGSLMLGTHAVEVGGTFTQQDVNDGQVNYVHGGSELATDAFTWQLTDGSHGLPATQFMIAITPVNDAPVVVANPLSTVAEGAMLVLDNTKLMATDVDSTLLTYTLVSAPTRGMLQKRPDTTSAFVPLTVNATFTQSDIANGNVRFVDPGIDDAKLAVQQNSSTQFSWRVSDGDGAVIPSAAGANVTTFTVTSVDDPPVVSWHASGCHVANRADPANPLVSISDPDNATSDYSICVVSIGGASGTVSQPNQTITVTAELPTLKNGAATLGAASCVPVTALTGLTLTSEVNEQGGSVTWQLRRNSDGKNFLATQTMTFATCP
jgi:VCBS repeat-containing protein